MRSPSHTTRHAGPHRAVPAVTVPRHRREGQSTVAACWAHLASTTSACAGHVGRYRYPPCASAPCGSAWPGFPAPRVRHCTLTALLPSSPRCHTREIINDSSGEKIILTLDGVTCFTED